MICFGNLLQRLESNRRKINEAHDAYDQTVQQLANMIRRKLTDERMTVRALAVRSGVKQSIVSSLLYQGTVPPRDTLLLLWRTLQPKQK
jgi:hypothetical protein